MLSLVGRRLLSGTALVAGSVGAPTATGTPAAAQPRVSFSLGKRVGDAYRWQYEVAVRVRPRAGTRPLSNLRVTVTGTMSVPGHAMQTPPTALRRTSNGTFTGRLAFYMPGNWTVKVGVHARGLAPVVKRFEIYLDPNSENP